MSIGLWSICTAGIFDRPLAFNFQGAIKRVSLNNQPCKATPTLADINYNETLFFIRSLSVLTSIEEVVILSTIHMVEYVF